jgi:hypothetical protein
MSMTNRANRAAVQGSLEKARAVHLAQAVHTLQDLQGALQQFEGMRPDAGSSGLRELMLRMHVLPPHQRGQALASWRAAVDRLPDTGDARPTEPPGLEDILRYPSAFDAVSEGEDVQHVARTFGIDATPRMEEILRYPNALLAVMSGENVDHVARCFGVIERPFEGIPGVNPMMAAQAMGAVVRGGNVQQTAGSYGITTQEGIRSLEDRAIYDAGPNSAWIAVRNGDNPRDVAERRGITTDEGISRLEAFTGGQRRRVDPPRDPFGMEAFFIPQMLNGNQWHGNPVRRLDHMDRFDMRRTMRRMEDVTFIARNRFGLEGAAIDSGGWGAVRNGENVQAVAARLGITTEHGVRTLEDVAIDDPEPNSAGSAVRNGENVQAVAARFGITTQEGVHRLEDVTINDMDGPNSAGRAVLNGQDVDVVAARHGLTDRGADRLQVLARGQRSGRPPYWF